MIDSFDASEINNWSDTADAENKLPELIRRLVLSTLPEPPTRVDMPSGSSVRLPGWDGLLEADQGNAWAPSGVSGWEMSCNKGVTSKANDDYEKRTADPLGLDRASTTFVFVTSRRWPGRRQWERERFKEGIWCDVRAHDADDLVTWLEQSPQVTRWFAGVVRKLPFDYEAVDRIEERQIEAKEQMSAGFADVADIKSAFAAYIATQGTPLSSDAEDDSEQQRLSERIDHARDLIQQGLIVAARGLLRRIEDEAEELPDALRFRITTNLAVCALGEDNFDEACSLLNEAHRIQPENPVGITNAALVAQLQDNPKSAAELARKALEIDPRDSNAAANLIWALWDMGESEQLEKSVTAEGWIMQEAASASALAGIRARQSRYDEAIDVYRSLIDADPDDAHAYLALSQCLLTYSQVDRLPIGYGRDSIKRLQEAEIAADRALEILQPTQLNVRYNEALLLRSGARALLGHLDDAMRDVDAAIAGSPGHPVALLHKGQILLKKGLPGEARAWLEGIQDPEVRADSLLPLADACLESGDARAAITLLEGSFKLDPPGREDIGRAESLMRAEAAIGRHDSVSPILETALKQYPENVELFILSAVRSNLHGDLEGYASALINAIELADEPHRQAIQTELGYLYASMRRFADAAEEFHKACGDEASHPAAVPMLQSMFNSRQFRKVLNLAQKIREIDDPAPRVVIEVEAEVLTHVGDAKAAALRYHELCSREDSTPNDRVRLAMAQFRCGEREASLETILNIDVAELGTDSQALMKLAYMKRFLGAADYLHDAYLSRRYGLNDPDAHMGYFRLFFRAEMRDWDEPVVVKPGCAIRIKSDNEEQWWRILEDGEESYGPRDLSSDDDLAQRLLGRNVGDTIVFSSGIGESLL